MQQLDMVRVAASAPPNVNIAVSLSFVADQCGQVAGTQNTNTKHKNRSSWRRTRSKAEQTNKQTNNEMLDKPINDTTESHNVSQV